MKVLRTKFVLRSLIMACASGVVAAAPMPERHWTVQDSIKVRYFVSHTPGSASFLGDEDFVVPSPDGRHFFFVMRHGDLASDSNVYEMHVHSVQDLKGALADVQRRQSWSPRPLRKVMLSDSHSELFSGAITEARWESSDSIVFRGAEGAGPHRVYRLDLNSSAILRFETGDIGSIEEGAGFRGGSFVVASLGAKIPWRPLDRYPMTTITDGELVQLDLDWRYDGREIYASYLGGPVKRIGTTPFLARTSVSPDGRWAVAVYEPSDRPVPAEWLNYERKPQAAYPGSPQFMLIDLQTGDAKPLINAPVGSIVTEMGRGIPSGMLWSADSKRLILINAALPLTDQQSERARTAYVVDYDIGKHSWSVLEPLQDSNGSKLKTAGWLRDGKELLIVRETRAHAAASGMRYTWRNQRWVGQTVPASVGLPTPKSAELPAGFTVTVRQSSNDPPVVIASDGQHEVALTDPDPALEGLWRAPVQEITWTEPDGRTFTGGLRLPRAFSKSAPPPLVLQPYSFRRDMFRPDGYFHNAHAAQALASEGMAVLEFSIEYLQSDMPDPRYRTTGTPREGPAFVERVDAAVDELTRQGLIDPSRVGLSGWSRSGFLTYYALTHPGRTKLAAALVHDAFTGSYFEYLADFAMGGGSPQAYEPLYRGAFWQNSTGWLREVPAFNLHRAQAPVLFAFPAGGRISAIEIIGGLRANERPFEFLYFPTSSHEPRRPREREAAMQANVDWMKFWLQGKTPADDERSLRWEKIRADWVKGQTNDANE